MRQRPRGCRALLLVLALLSLSAQAEETTRAYRGLWGSLFQKQAGSGGESRPSASDRFRQALADLQSLLHPSDDTATSSSSSSSSSNGASGSSSGLRHLPSLEDVAEHVGNLTASLLDSAHAGSGGTSALLQRLARDFNLSHSPAAGTSSSLDAAQLAATVASMQAWALAGLVARSGGSGLSGGGGGASSLSSSLDPSSFKQVADPAWASFKPHTCMRLQNFGNAEGYNAALLGAAPSGKAGAVGSVPPGGAAAASGDALRWGSQASFLLDCSRGGSLMETATSGSGGAAGSSGSISAALHAAASKAASAVEAALDRTTTCRLGVTAEGDGAGGAGGSGALLHHSFERPLLGGTKLDALRVRVCNIAPSTLQFPAALARGPAISVSSLKLNGRPLLRAPLHVSLAAAAADGCLALLYRLPSRATKSGFVLTGFVHLGEGSGGSGGSGGSDGNGSPSGSGSQVATGQAPSSGGQFGVGEMASLELTLGEYSALDAAATRLLGGIAGGGGQAAGQP
ncbi:hypothetical protein C2E21_5558 [Chlorella sorokiniana]|uniref:Uncharacterized protein n=1 Tax=Chlorella sorokiniana TaxID=3076 RepID=A0A2P6TN84_CHLSO|nr:hypothetical protein C2E21_5558 [Chlorella sorokiniana]|eukprot:PRW50791.1 hypothetical protein C2E21_5558 [Chlorella sorokiniana]